MADDTLELKEAIVSLQEANTAIEKQNVAFVALTKTNDTLQKEIEKKGAADVILVKQVADLNDEVTKQGKIVTAFELAAKRKSKTFTDANGNEIDLEAKAQAWASTAGGSSDKFGADAMGEYKSTMEKLIRNNMRPESLSDVERKALSVGSSSDGGYLVEPDMSGRIVKQIYETSAVRAYASVQTISTDSLEGFYDNDEVGFGWVAELESRTDTSTPQIGRWTIPVHEMYAMPKASQKLLDDAIIPIESWLNQKIADKFARGENAAFVAGDGAKKPRGWLDYPDGTDLTNSIKRFQTGVNGDFAAAPDGGDILIDALYGLKADFRAKATWFMNTVTQSKVRLLKDSDGRMLWAPSIAAGQPALLFGYPVAIFEDMPNMATGSLSITVGDLGAAYQIVDRMGIRMLRDPYTNKGSVLFYATKRTGGDMINGEAIKNIEFSA